MRRLLVIAVAVSMVLISVPTALSQPIDGHEDGDGWRAGYYNTNYEPNVPGYDDGSTQVPFDEDPTKMWQDANQDRADKIYFDVIPAYTSFPSTPWPQTGDDQPRQQALQYQFAELGFWRDCNGDGYVGSAVTGAQTYPLDQLREESTMNGHTWEDTCPIGDREEGVESHVDLLYNDGVQVRELVPIGYQDRDAESGDETQKDLDDDLLCPDRNNGPSGSGTEAGAQRSGTERTETGNGVLQGGENVACYHAGTDFAVQDDFVKVGWHLESPDEGESGTSSIVPPPDGITTDSNGFFWWVDNQNLGKASETFPGLWPTKYNHEGDDPNDQDHTEYDDGQQWDPRQPNQCEEHADPTEDTGGTAGVAAADNLEQFAAENGDPTEYPDRGEAWASDFTDLRKSRDTALVTCSPVPNMQYIDVDNDHTTDMDRFAWPLHIAEDRYSNEESSDDDPKPVTDPFKCKDGAPGGMEGTGVQEDPSSWDEEDDADPIADSSDPHKYYGPNHDGPSVYPVVDRAVEMLEAHAGTSSCDQSYDGDNIETYGAGGAEPGGPRDEMGYEMNYDSGECVNPAKSPGIDQADTPVCHNVIGQSYDYESGKRAQDYSYWWGTNFIDVPDEPPDFWAGRTFSHTGYADVSFGVVSEDDAGNCEYQFDPAGDDMYASGSSNCFPQASSPLADNDGDGQPDGDNRGGIFDAGPLNPDLRDGVTGWGDYLPAGQDDAHTFADLHCTSFSGLDTANGGTDDFGDASSDNPFNMRNCDRQDWVDADNIDCTLTGDNPGAELSCYLNWKPGDRYDLWDITCMDNDVQGSDAIGAQIGNRDCATQTPTE